jgi:hypothetical protein
MSSVLEEKQSATKLSDARISPLAGKPAPTEILVDLARLEKEYFDRKLDLEDPNQLVAFGRRAHRCQINEGPGQPCSDWRTEGGCEIRLVRRSAIRNGKHLQDLCRKLQRRVTSESDHSRGSGDR